MARYSISTTADEEAGLAFAATAAGQTSAAYLAARVKDMLASYCKDCREAEYAVSSMKSSLDELDEAGLTLVSATLSAELERVERSGG